MDSTGSEIPTSTQNASSLSVDNNPNDTNTATNEPLRVLSVGEELA